MNKEELMKELASPLELAQDSLQRLDDTLALAKVVHSRQEQDQLLEELSEVVVVIRSLLEAASQGGQSQGGQQDD